MKQSYLIFSICLGLLFSACKKEMIQPQEEQFAKASRSLNEDIIFYALGNNVIDKYSTANAEMLLSTASISNLQSGEMIIAIDFRPATGQLYGISNQSRLYIIDPMTGIARMVGTGPLSPALSATVTGFDFNPTVDRLRIVSGAGENYRVNPETGAVIVDGPINGVDNAMITASAYSDNYAGASSTILYNIDITTDKLYRQSPPNNGTLVEVGALNINVEGESGFDISPSGSALALIENGMKTDLMVIDLITGKAKKLDKFNKEKMYFGIAIPTLPVAYAVSNGSFLIFNPTSSETPVSKTIMGLQVGEKIIGFDFRPLNGQIFAIGSNSRIYTINTASGGATFVASISVPLSGEFFGVDFNPVVDRIRIVSNTGQNLRVNPLSGATIADGNLNPGSPNVSAAAYTNNFPGTSTTQLFVVDYTSDKLYIQTPPNLGTLMEVGNLGVNIESNNGFDIGGTSNNAYGIFTSGNNTSLYSINKTTGQAIMMRSFSANISAFTIGLGF